MECFITILVILGAVVAWVVIGGIIGVVGPILLIILIVALLPAAIGAFIGFLIDGALGHDYFFTYICAAVAWLAVVSFYISDRIKQKRGK